ncbi:hypothetical protein FGO68_gene4926 [Halteria grandinella]|uniref:Uncharacterized protein n=1 Tax=Halteria grandinella TaxID=5974 RepID=A0A8J8P359_HALGN|nr:hypothetical protein FGO68_gene4926 [Halteria grandinella]
MYSFLNLGSSLLFSLLLLFLFIIYYLCDLLSPHFTTPSKVASILSRYLFWGSSTRFLIQQFQPLLITALINLYSIRLVSWVATFSVLFSLTALLALVISLYKMIREINLTPHSALSKYCPPLTEGINPSSLIGRYWIPITLIKWSLLSLTLVTLRNHPSFQLITTLFIIVTSQVLLITGKPFASPVENGMSLFNDVMASVYLYGLYTLTDAMGRNEVKEGCGVGMLVLVIGTILANVGKVVVQVVMGINFKKYWHKLTQSDNQVVKLQPASEPIVSLSTTNVSIDDHSPPLKMMKHQVGKLIKKGPPPLRATTHVVKLHAREINY